MISGDILHAPEILPIQKVRAPISRRSHLFCPLKKPHLPVEN
jgi:hypothetical protein